jgi:hypothetical protein
MIPRCVLADETSFLHVSDSIDFVLCFSFQLDVLAAVNLVVSLLDGSPTISRQSVLSIALNVAQPKNLLRVLSPSRDSFLLGLFDRVFLCC